MQRAVRHVCPWMVVTSSSVDELQSVALNAPSTADGTLPRPQNEPSGCAVTGEGVGPSTGQRWRTLARCH